MIAPTLPPDPPTRPGRPSLRLVGVHAHSDRRGQTTRDHRALPPRNARAARAYGAATTPAQTACGAKPPHASGRKGVDPRWAFAARVAVAADGPVPGTISPERRQRLIAAAGRLGIRTFEATLIIAAIQDRLRSGLPALGPELGVTLGIICPTPSAAAPADSKKADSASGDAAPEPMPGPLLTSVLVVSVALVGVWALAGWISG